MRRVGFAVASGFLALLATLVLAEGLLRVVQPRPRVQVVRSGLRDGLDFALRWVDGVPVWPSPADDLRHNRGCVDDPERTRWLVLGSSILAADGLAPEEAFSLRLQEALGEAGRPACVVNLAEGAYTFQNQAAVAAEALPEVRPDVVLWEIWANSPGTWVRVGDTAYRFQHLAVSEDGTPNPLGLPGTLHRGLLGTSRLYEAGVLALVAAQEPVSTGEWERLLATALPDALAAVRAQGATLVLALAPPLDQPFAAWTAARRRAEGLTLAAWYTRVEAWARAEGVAVVALDELLADHDVEALRLDPCCHYDVAGQQVLGDALAAWWLEHAQASPSEDGEAPGDHR
ncbi:MAG: hypothetical protein H6732_13780 [Alphaproteobacteria bacterium]|nr:hypothetical protein [Alphaproteobacteria bacterium]